METGWNFPHLFPLLLVARWMQSPMKPISDRPMGESIGEPTSERTERECSVMGAVLLQKY